MKNHQSKNDSSKTTNQKPQIKTCLIKNIKTKPKTRKMTRRKQQNKNELLKDDEHFFSFFEYLFIICPQLTRSSLQTLLLQEFLL